MTIRKVQPGQPMRIPANAYNAFVDAARAHSERSGRTGAGAMALSETVRVKNTTASAVPRGGVLAITGSLIDPANNEGEFLRSPGFTGAAPSGPDDKFVVAAEPIAAGKIGRCVADGLAHTRLLPSDADHGFAVPKASETGYLESDAAAGAEIVWDEGGTSEQWAVVRIGGGSDSLIQPAQATAIYSQDGTSYHSNGYEVEEEFPKWCEANPCDPDGSNPDTGTTLYIKLNDSVAAPVGYEPAVGDLLGVLPVTQSEDAPGTSPTKQYTHWCVWGELHKQRASICNKTANGTANDPDESTAIAAAKADACSAIQSECGDKGFVLCPPWTTTYDSGTGDATASITYNCCCHDDQMQIEITDYRAGNPFAIDSECNLTTLTWKICVDEQEPCDEDCP